MRAVLTRVSSASVTVDGETVGAIDCPGTGGLLALVGVGREDEPGAWETMVRKIAELRILDGELGVVEAGAPVLLVSQFTLHGRTAKGRRPSWSDAAPGEVAEPTISSSSRMVMGIFRKIWAKALARRVMIGSPSVAR